jgi:hypothetical protein
MNFTLNKNNHFSFCLKTMVYECLSPYLSQFANCTHCKSHHQDNHNSEENPSAIAKASQPSIVRDILEVGNRGGYH